MQLANFCRIVFVVHYFACAYECWHVASSSVIAMAMLAIGMCGKEFVIFQVIVWLVSLIFYITDQVLCGILLSCVFYPCSNTVSIIFVKHLVLWTPNAWEMLCKSFFQIKCKISELEAVALVFTESKTSSNGIPLTSLAAINCRWSVLNRVCARSQSSRRGRDDLHSSWPTPDLFTHHSTSDTVLYKPQCRHDSRITLQICNTHM